MPGQMGACLQRTGAPLTKIKVLVALLTLCASVLASVYDNGVFCSFCLFWSCVLCPPDSLIAVLKPSESVLAVCMGCLDMVLAAVDALSDEEATAGAGGSTAAAGKPKAKAKPKGAPKGAPKRAPKGAPKGKAKAKTKAAPKSKNKKGDAVLPEVESHAEPGTEQKKDEPKAKKPKGATTMKRPASSSGASMMSPKKGRGKRPTTAAGEPTAPKVFKVYKYKYKDNHVWGFKTNMATNEFFRVRALTNICCLKETVGVTLICIVFITPSCS